MSNGKRPVLCTVLIKNSTNLFLKERSNLTLEMSSSIHTEIFFSQANLDEFS